MSGFVLRSSAPTKFFSLLFVICANVFLQSAFAASTSGSAKVYLLDSIDLEEKQVVDYGALVNENGTCTLTASGELQGSEGSSCTGQGQVGEFMISGSTDQMVEISVSEGESLSGITFTPKLHSEQSTVLANGFTTARVGGDLSLENASEGSHSISYTISVNYN